MSIATENAKPATARTDLLQKARNWSDGHPEAASVATTAPMLISLILLFYSVNERFICFRNIGIILNQSATYPVRKACRRSRWQ